MIFWITGLSASGKTTLAHEVASQLKQLALPVVLLDGDELREVFNVSNGTLAHKKDTRLNLAMQYSKLCHLLSQQGLIVVIATISMFKEIHEWNRDHFKRYFEVYLKVPITELRRRDPKGIYKKFDAGLLKNVAGLDLEIDEPIFSDIVIEFNFTQSIKDTAAKIVSQALKKWEI